MVKQLPADLRVIGLFEDLSDEDLARVARGCVVQSHCANDQILNEQDCTSDVFFILRGQLRISSYSGAGREIIYSDVGVGGIFGEFSAVDRQPRSATVIAMTDCVLARMPANDFYDVMTSCDGVAAKLVEVLIRKIRSMSARVFEVSALAVRERVARELIRLSASGKMEGGRIIIEPAPTHYEIAARVGSHREAVTRELGKLEAAGIVLTRRRQIHVVSQARLEALAEGNIAILRS